MHRSLSLIVLIAVLSGCSSVVVSPDKARKSTPANLFNPVPGKALVFVYRDASLRDAYYASKLFINGYEISSGAMNSYNALLLPPGDYVVGVTSSYQKEDYVPTDVHFAEGSVHYLNVYWEKDYGFRLRAVIDDNARKAIVDARMLSYKDVCPDPAIDPEQKKQLQDSQIFFRGYKKGLCPDPNQ